MVTFVEAKGDGDGMPQLRLPVWTAPLPNLPIPLALGNVRERDRSGVVQRAGQPGDDRRIGMKPGPARASAPRAVAAPSRC